MSIYIKSINNVRDQDYGNILNGLLYGIKFFYKVNSTSQKVYLKTIYNNNDWKILCKDDIRINDNYFQCRWKFNDCIYLEKTGIIGVEIKDNLTSLLDHNIVIQGYN